VRWAEAAYRLGESYLAEGDAQGAERWLEGAAAVQASPRQRDARFALGYAAMQRADWSTAEKHLERLLAPEADSTGEARFLFAECAFRRQDFQAAADRLQSALAATEGELRAKCLFRLGLALGELERFAGCERTLSELAQRAPQFPNLAEAELMRGRALRALKKPRAARAAFERTLALDQGDLAARARLGLAHSYEDEGALDAALSDYLKVALLFAHEPSVCEALLGAGRVLEAQGQSAQAAERYAELVREHPGSPFAAPARERLRALGAPSIQETDVHRRKPRADGG
jgi:TolA-binding protein